ncbi:hypothetical protein [Clostridium lundense]|uniref:hypothetical protein n=1 Tax=Clostridium lundense TaxID=319475 RepID=UPI00068913F0|nr:hypothetical protein [Clostridium lundense]
MKFKEKSTCKKSISTKVLYTVGSVVALIAVSSLINNIMMFKEAITQYVAQGYNYTEVIKQLISVQLLPGVFESIAMYGGMSVVLFAAGVINEKVSKSLVILSEAEVDKDVIEEGALDGDVIDVENIDKLPENLEELKEVETVEKVNEVSTTEIVNN